MKNFILSILLLFITSSYALAETKVVYKISLVHGLIKFIAAISGEPHQSANLVEIFKRQKQVPAEVTRALATIQSFNEILNNGVSFKMNTPDRPDGTDIRTFILIQSIFAKDLNDLSERTLGLLPLNVHQKYFAAINTIQPFYKNLIWDKSISELQSHQLKLENLAKKANLNAMFTKAKIFYNANWPDDLNFTIGLYPIPYIKDSHSNSTISQSLGSTEEHGVLIGGKTEDIEGSLGVIFHELCHSLYGSESPDYINQLSSYFKNSHSPYREQAHFWLNEALATSIGNGWAYTLFTKGKVTYTINSFLKTSKSKKHYKKLSISAN